MVHSAANDVKAIERVDYERGGEETLQLYTFSTNRLQKLDGSLHSLAENVFYAFFCLCFMWSEVYNT